MANAATAQAYRALEEMIVTLALAPGSTTTEAAMIEATGLGRTPVREAVQRLAWEGLMAVRPRAGLMIAPLHPADWLRVVDARRGVEAVLAAGAARFLVPAQADALRATAEVLKESLQRADPSLFLQADKALDETVAQAADNPFAARLAAPLQAHSRRCWFRFQAAAGLHEAAERHLALIDAVLSRNEPRARSEADRLMNLLRDQAEAAARR